MADEASEAAAGGTKRILLVVVPILLFKRWVDDARCDRRYPWYLDDRPDRKRRMSVLIYGALRRSGAMLRVSFLVLKSWWKHPLEPEIPTNGSNLVANALGGVFRPVLWMASVGVAGVVGSDFASSRSSAASSLQLVIWIYIAIGVAVLLVAYHWWKLLERLRRVLVSWVVDCNQQGESDRRTTDIALFGYTFGDNFRRRFNAKGVRFLAALSFSAALYVTYGLGHH